VSDERLRLFVALELPDEVRDELVAWRTPVLRDIHALRPVARESLHVTLCFLGWRAVADVGPIGEAMRAAVSAAVAGGPPVRLSLARGVWLPPRRPRLVAVDLSDTDGALARVQGDVSRALEAGGWYEPEARPFMAHVTLARVGRRVKLRASELPAIPALEFEGSRVVLYRSRLARGGAQYEPLVSVDV
jgi:RNA 2',3'-cyclic 3'-phosphodiesterase